MLHRSRVDRRERGSQLEQSSMGMRSAWTVVVVEGRRRPRARRRFEGNEQIDLMRQPCAAARVRDCVLASGYSIYRFNFYRLSAHQGLSGNSHQELAVNCGTPRVREVAAAPNGRLNGRLNDRHSPRSSMPHR